MLQLCEARQDQQVFVLELFARQYRPVLVQVFDEEVVTIQRLGSCIFAHGCVDAVQALEAQAGRVVLVEHVESIHSPCVFRT